MIADVHGQHAEMNDAMMALTAEDREREAAEAFDPTPGIIQIEGKGKRAEYLPVNWRVLWLRREHPAARIVTEQVQLSADSAVFKATITLEDGAIGTGFGSQSAAQFKGGFLEKAETKAIGRACAALGYGTLAAFEEGNDTADKADTPASRSEPSAAAPTANEWDWPKLWVWLKSRGIVDRAGIDHAARRGTDGMQPGDIHRVITAVDKLVKMPDDKLEGIIRAPERPEALRLGAAHEHFRRADDEQTLRARYGAIGNWLTKEQRDELYWRHMARLGLAPPAAPVPAAPAAPAPPAPTPAPAPAPAPSATATPAGKPATDAQILAMKSLARQRGISEQTIVEMARATYQVEGLKQLSTIQAHAMIEDIRRQEVVEGSEAAS